MRLLIDHGAYENFGDLAMLEAALARLRRIEDSTLHVQHSPMRWPWDNVCEVAYEIRPPGTLIRRTARLLRLPETLAGPLRGAAERWRRCAHRALATANFAPVYPMRVGGRPATVHRFCGQFDALYVAGGGDLNDLFPEALWRCCCLIDGFSAQGKPVYLSGQQIGPIRWQESHLLLRSALRRAAYLGIREPNESLRFCERAALDAGRVALTGDDSFGIAPAPEGDVAEVLARHGVERGRFIAVNVRIGRYVAVDADALSRLGRLLNTIQARAGVPLLAVPISVADGDSDIKAARLLAGHISTGEFRVLDRGPFSAQLLKGVLGAAYGAVGMSYHFGTFALSQGVPAVALHAGDYYAQKALGLSGYWRDERLAQSIDAIDPGTAPKIVALFADNGFRERLRASAEKHAQDWELAFRQNVVEPLQTVSRSRTSRVAGA